MTYIKKLILLLFSLLCFNQVVAEDFNLSIIDLDSSNSNLIKIFLDKNIISNSGSIEGDIKIFKDLKSKNIIKDLENSNIITIDLISELEKNTSYSLLSVYGVEGTIDFKTTDLINGLEILGNGNTGIDKINIIDSKKLKITFSKNIIGEDIDIKILKEFIIKGLNINKENNKIIEGLLVNDLDISSDYLVMLFSFTTIEGNNYFINNSIYDFSTKGKLDKAIIENNIINEKDKVSNIALNSAETPDTGAETWILFLATFILSNFIYFRKKFNK